MGESLHAIVLAGGSGTRLWPLSRGELPKQFLHLFGNESLFQGTLKRLRPLAGERIKVISPGCFSDLVLQQSGAAGLDQKSLLLVEPCAKNTAPAIALGIATLVEEGCTEDTPVLVCPSDHVINEDEKFIQAVRYGLEAISEGAIVVFGIAPKSLETGFGYIRAGESRGSWFRVDEFVEKPDAKRAAALLDEGGWFWNGGIFLFRLGDILDAFRAHLPRIGELLQGGVINLLDQYSAFPSISIDYGIIERHHAMAVVPLDTGWADLGRRAVAQNVSDVLAMGADCSRILVALAVPGHTVMGDIAALAEGIHGEARRSGAVVVGGDLTSAGVVVVGVTAIGTLPDGAAPLRIDGAHPGDRIGLTGLPGRSAAGLALLLAGPAAATIACPTRGP